MYDLKTIHGKSSVMNRLLESIGQSNHILLNMTTEIRVVLLANCIKRYFEINPSALEVVIFKKNKMFVLKRKSVESKDYIKKFLKRYNK